jgi:hypothetical protein
MAGSDRSTRIQVNGQTRASGGRRNVTAGDVRIPRARLIVIAFAVLVGVVLLVATRTYLWYFDEWDFILAAPTWDAGSVLQPHNEHPAMLLRLVYALLLNTVGLRSYAPYMAILLALHATSAVLLFEVIRRRAGDLVGMAAAVLLLVLGAGWENLLWAFQIGFVGSVASGLAMILVLDRPAGRRRGALTALWVAASLMFSGVGLAFLVFAAVLIGVQRARWKEAIWLAPVVVLLAIWLVAYGGSGAQVNPPPTAANIVLVPIYAAYGAGAAAAGLLGLGAALGPYVGFLALGALVWRWWRHHELTPFAIAAAAALISFYVIVGASRAQLGYQQSAAGRYVYEGALFWLLLLGDVARDLPWRGTWRPALAACLFLATFNSSVLLFEYTVAKTAQMDRERQDLYALAYVRTVPCVSVTGSVDPLVMPQVRNPLQYWAAVDRFGSPTPDADRHFTTQSVLDSSDYRTAVTKLCRTS